MFCYRLSSTVPTEQPALQKGNTAVFMGACSSAVIGRHECSLCVAAGHIPAWQ